MKSYSFKKKMYRLKAKKCQKVMKEYWGLIVEFTNGDMSMLPKLMEVGSIDTAANAWEERQKIVNDYVGPGFASLFFKTWNKSI